MKRLVLPPDPTTLHRATRFRVLYADTDAMRVMYHGNYARYLEQARVEFMRQRGLIYAEMETQGLGLPVSDASISYLQPSVYDDQVTVWVGVSRLSPARLHFGYEMTIETGDRPGTDERILIAHAETRHACILLDTQLPTRLPHKLIDTLSEAAPRP
ncbi:MAG: acyl-CoA thioesterase [Nannocystaceae bacterium]